MKRNQTEILAISVSLIITISLLTGCSPNTTTFNSAPNKNEFLDTKKTMEPSNYWEEVFMDVGQKVKIWYLQHYESNRYQVGLRESDKQLTWKYIYPEAVYLVEDIDNSYIERIADKNTFLGTSPAYVLYLKVGTPIEGGAISNERNSEIETEMIIGGGS